MLEGTLSCTHHNRLIHVFKRDVAGQVLQDLLLHNLTFPLAPLVLRVDPILSLLNISFLKLFEVVVCVIFLLLLGVLPVNESKCLIEKALAILVMARFHSSLNVVFVRLIDPVELLIHNLVVSRFSLLVLLFDLLEVLDEISLADLVLGVAIIEPLPLTDIDSGEE